jgi:hypothetical protein
MKPKITKSQRAVYDVIRAHPEGLTNAEIAYYLKTTINRVTGRTFELKSKPLEMIYDDGIRTCRVNHTAAHAYKVVVQLLLSAFEKPPEAVKRSDTNKQHLL